ncbi:MAG: hypothetical protein JM58_14700 [Peptococcaceae bacterium BICA1-8]|nr:MAG: hypothetical protein JM58_14700 [Peptococcaceae bacterium BICA1-8]
MEYSKLGNTEIKVSELCFGLLPIGPLQANIPLNEGAYLITKALENGVNFFDTAEAYKTYEYITTASKGFSGEIIVASKSKASDYHGMENSIHDALDSLQRDYIDIFLLHAARATDKVFEERQDALRCLLNYKEKGFVRAIGISTHSVKVVEKASEINEIDVVYPLINLKGRGILDGGVNEMLEAIKKCATSGKGLYAMKALAGGNLVNELTEAISFVRNIEYMNSVSIGMINEQELDINLSIFNNQVISKEVLKNLTNSKKIHIFWRHCIKCGICIKTCPNNALELGTKSVVIDHNKCILCGYCSPVCPQFCIRML